MKLELISEAALDDNTKQRINDAIAQLTAFRDGNIAPAFRRERILNDIYYNAGRLQRGIITNDTNDGEVQQFIADFHDKFHLEEQFEFHLTAPSTIIYPSAQMVHISANATLKLLASPTARQLLVESVESNYDSYMRLKSIMSRFSELGNKNQWATDCIFYDLRLVDVKIHSLKFSGNVFNFASRAKNPIRPMQSETLIEVRTSNNRIAQSSLFFRTGSTLSEVIQSILLINIIYKYAEKLQLYINNITQLGDGTTQFVLTHEAYSTQDKVTNGKPRTFVINSADFNTASEAYANLVSQVQKSHIISR